MRLRDWDVRLFAAIDEMAHMPFSARTNNCAQFAARLVEAMTGEPVAFDWSPRKMVIARKNIEHSVTRVLSVEPIPPQLAMRGDVVLLEGGALGICVGSEAVAIGVRGIEYVPMSSARIAWPVR